jgi:hypothetical protein
MSLASHAPAGIAVPHPPPRPRHTPLSFSSWGLEGGLFTLSAALLALEILQTKIFAFSLEPTAMSIAIAVCLLGLGASATVLTLFPRLREEERARSVAAAYAVAGGLAVPLAHAVFARVSPTMFDAAWRTVATLIVLTIPYFCFGMAIALVLVSRAAAAGRAYAINLAGSGLGCLLVFPLLDRLGAERALLAVAALALLAAVMFASLRPRNALLGVAIVTIGLLAGFRWASEALVFQPEPMGQVRIIERRIEALRKEHPNETISFDRLFTRWDRTTRVDVFRLTASLPELQSRFGGPIETLFFAQDSSAGSFLLGVGDDLSRGRVLFEDTVYAAGYVPHAVETALIIGLGGAPDVLTALHHGVRTIDAVDINRTTIDIVRNEFGAFLGHPYDRPEVTTHQVDGRTFLRQTNRAYDLIEMSGVDTKSMYAAGMLAVNETYLYTREAMRDVLARLRPNGILNFIRVAGREPPRLASIAMAGLRDVGAATPERNLFVVTQGMYSSVLVKRSPFTADELERLHAWVARAAAPDIAMPAYEWFGLKLGNPVKVLYSPEPRLITTTPYFEALAKGQVDAFVAAAPEDLSSPVDDRPFFFFFTRPADALRAPPESLALLLRALVYLVGIAALLILLPLAILRGRGLAMPQAGRALAYFACLGAGFMLIEIGLIQRFVVLLGHQSYAITVVLFGLLVGSGIGSMLSSWMPISSPVPMRALIAALITVVVGYAIGLGIVFDGAAGSGFITRLSLALALLVALGVMVGMPFPVALRALQTAGSPLVSWGIGVNGFASVLGATLALPVAMLVGLRAVLGLGALLYLIALLTVPFPRAAPTPILPRADTDGSPRRGARRRAP